MKNKKKFLRAFICTNVKCRAACRVNVSVFIDSPELNPDVAGTQLPICPTAYRNLVTRPTHTEQSILNTVRIVLVARV